MSVRKRIIEFLKERGGEFHAPEGNAGVQLAKALGEDYNNVSTALYRMVRKGEVLKEGKGRRAYSYKLSTPPKMESIIQPSAPTTQPVNGETDYDKLAAALLRRVVAIEAGQNEGSEVYSRLRAAQAEIRSLKTERDEYRKRWRETRNELEELQEQARNLERELSLSRGGTTVRDQLDPKSLAILDRMMRERPTGRGDDDEG